MKTSSAKAKGRRAAQQVKDLMLSCADAALSVDDINVTPAGVTGPDLTLSPKAQMIYPMTIEVKNQEKLNIWQALRQAENHPGANPPVLFFTKNRARLYAAMPADILLAIWAEAFLNRGDL